MRPIGNRAYRARRRWHLKMYSSTWGRVSKDAVPILAMGAAGNGRKTSKPSLELRFWLPLAL